MRQQDLLVHFGGLFSMPMLCLLCFSGIRIVPFVARGSSRAGWLRKCKFVNSAGNFFSTESSCEGHKNRKRWSGTNMYDEKDVQPA